MKVVIVAKTRMGSCACIGALSFEGRSLRLIAKDADTNSQFNMEYQVGDVWEIDAIEPGDLTSPHTENIIVEYKKRSNSTVSMVDFINQHMPPNRGGLEVLFEGLTLSTKKGSLYITEENGIPSFSTMFWMPNKSLECDDSGKRIRYRYSTHDGGRTITYTGFQEPVMSLPAGTLLRISLAHWWRPTESPNNELRCYVQLSGWIVPPNDHSLHRKIRCNIPANTHNYAKNAQEIPDVLKTLFGFRSFLPFQREVIENILKKIDTLAVMPTGSGKSLCFQLPATIFSGLTVVVSPLISLMEDQILHLQELGISALFLNSTLSHNRYLDAVSKLRSGEIKLLYAAPETLIRPETMLLLEDCQVDCLVIDEAHCISEWGHNFRPEYRQLSELRARLPNAVTLAVTATATKIVRQDIKRSLDITDANEFVGGFDRKNLILNVVDKLKGLVQTRNFLDAHKGQAGIIYCTTRKQVDTLTDELSRLGYQALGYHAGMDYVLRREHQRRFIHNEGIIIVATIAFGMGIDKSNVRFILHYNLPKDLENYYQQIGRAGRDGLTADCLLLFTYSDVFQIRHFINKGGSTQKKSSEQRLEKLLDLINTQGCRRKPLLEYFSESTVSEKCDGCDNCLSGPIVLSQKEIIEKTVDKSRKEENLIDLTIPAQKFLSCVKRLDESFGVDHTINVLRGSKSKKVLRFNHDKLSTYGIGNDLPKEHWKQLAIQFLRLGLLERNQRHGSLRITQEGAAVLKGKSVTGAQPKTTWRTKVPLSELVYDKKLFKQLRDLRLSIARERKVPPYVIFHDRTLIEMAIYYPANEEDFLKIDGVGQSKLKQYSSAFLALIKAHFEVNKIRSPIIQKNKPSTITRPSTQSRRDYIWRKYQNGRSIQNLADDLGFSQETILKHLKSSLDQGRSIRQDGLMELSTLTDIDERNVEDAFSTHGTEYLKPVFDVLNQKIPYDQLHLWRLIFIIRQSSNSCD